MLGYKNEQKPKFGLKVIIKQHNATSHASFYLTRNRSEYKIPPSIYALSTPDDISVRLPGDRAKYANRSPK